MRNGLDKGWFVGKQSGNLRQELVLECGLSRYRTDSTHKVTARNRAAAQAKGT